MSYNSGNGAPHQQTYSRVTQLLASVAGAIVKDHLAAQIISYQ